MGVKEWIGDIHNPSNVRPRVIILWIIIGLATFVLIKGSCPTIAFGAKNFAFLDLKLY